MFVVKLANTTALAHEPCDPPPETLEERLSLGFPSRLLTLARATWLRLLLLVAGAIAVHLPALSGQLIWDDNYLVGENPFFRSPILSLEVFRHYLFLDSFSGHYRPVQNLSYMLDYLLWNGDPWGYHLSNTVWHASAGVLLFFLLRRLTAAWGKTEHQKLYLETGSYLVALVWVLHPVHSAAVDYISGRADSLAFAFSAGAWLIYLRAAESRRPLRRTLGYGCAAFFILLGLCSREIAFVWVVTFLVHLMFFQRDASLRHRIVCVGMCVLILGTYAGLRRLPESRPKQAFASEWDATARAGLMLRALGDYTRLTVFPTNLHMERSVTAARMFRAASWQDRFAFSWLSVLGLIAAAALFAGMWKRGPGRPLRIFGALWFTFGFLPISNLVQLNATAAEHWLYFPLVGLLMVFFGWMIELPPRFQQAATALALCVAGAFGVRSTVRSGDWLSPQIFYERTIAAAGWSPRVGMNLGIIYGKQGRLDEARLLLERTLAAWPDYPLARSHLAIILAQQGATQRADALLAATAEKASQQRYEYPRTWLASLQLAKAENRKGNNDEALRVLAAARELEPMMWPLAELQCEIIRQTQGPEAALPIVEEFTKAYWWQYPAFLALGKLKAQQGDVPSAIAALTHASRLDIHETDALNLIARIQLRAKNLPAALGAQRRAVARQPDEPSQYILFSEVLLEMGRTEQAQEAREKARQLEEQGLAAAQA